jgi:hypothetical protein
MTDAPGPGHAVELGSGDLTARVGFRVAHNSGLAGGPVELEFQVSVAGARPLALLVSGDRARRRPGDFVFTARIGDHVLTDPLAALPDLGGPAGVLEVATGAPYRQTLLLNDFVTLESTRDDLAPGETGRVVVTCVRAVPLAPDEESLFAPEVESPLAEVVLSVDLRRDDPDLVELVDDHLAQVVDGPVEHRERSLGILLALRSPVAVERWRVLADHPDEAVSERARWSLLHAGWAAY